MGRNTMRKKELYSETLKVMVISFSEIIPIFTQMQDDSKLDDPPPENACHRPMYLSKSKMTPKNKTSPKENILLLIAYTSYTKHVRLHLTLPISITLSSFTGSALIFLTLTLSIPILYTATA